LQYPWISWQQKLNHMNEYVLLIPVLTIRVTGTLARVLYALLSTTDMQCIARSCLPLSTLNVAR
jgi:hypothetical protein